MAEAIPVSPTGDAMRIGRRSIDDVDELLRRRRLSDRTRQHYLSYIRRAERFCRSHGLELDELDSAGLSSFVATLPVSRPSVMAARAALEHYWAAIGYRDRPSVDAVAILGKGGQDPASIRAARERADRTAAARRAPTGACWAETGYDARWLRDRFLARGLSPLTARGYVAAVRRVRAWCDENGTALDTMTIGELGEFSAVVPFTRSSRMQMRSALEHYWALDGRCDPPSAAMRIPRRPRMRSKSLDDSAAQALEEAAIARRDRKGLAVIIGLYLGLRRFEIAGLRWGDFGTDGWVTIIGKGDLTATLPVQSIVRDYLASTPRTSDFVFPGRSGGSVTPTTVWGWVREVSEEAGLGKIATHVLRHTALTIANDRTGDLRAVQEFARHARPETTAGYTMVTTKRLEKVADAIALGYRPVEAPPVEAPAPASGGRTVPFAEFISLALGTHAVGPWCELAELLAERPGWRLDGSRDGALTIFYCYGSDLTADVATFTNERPPSFSLTRTLSEDEDDVAWWHFPDAPSLGAVLGSFENGEPLPFPPSAYVFPPQDAASAT